MSELRKGSVGPGVRPAPRLAAPPAIRASAMRPARWIEATMRRHELPGTVDIAKRDGTLAQLTRLILN